MFRQSLIFLAFHIAVLGLYILPAMAQHQNLSTADRIAMLYAPQLNFTRDGDPLIRLGLLEDRDTVTFTPSQPIRVMPQGEGGAEIHLPANIKYTVSVSDSTPGEYKHWVVVERLSVGQRDRLNDIIDTWKARGYTPETFEVGGLFGIQGQLFDSRIILISVAGTNDLRAARRTRTQLEARYGIASSVHSERRKYPGGTMTLSAEGMAIKIVHKDILWISALPNTRQEVAYTIPNIPRPYGQSPQTRRYTGELIFAPDRNGRIAVINSLGAERVLKGVVPAEIFASAPEGALRAQSIAARTEMFSAIGVRNLADPYMLRADVYDQVYGGINVEHARTSAAVDATRGQIIFYDDKIISAVYSSNAGGFTENNENVWDAEPRPYLRGRVDAPANEVPAVFRQHITDQSLSQFLASDFPAHSKTAPVSSSQFYRWEKTVDISEPQKWLRENGQEVGRIKDIRILSRGVSGRVIRLEIYGDKGKTTVERELNARRLFGGLRSGLFTMDIDRDNAGYIQKLRFKGAGFGHGVGMCQTGAMGMASKGYSHEDILTHYYRGVEIRKLYR